jgi:Nif-specific regulatory protein
MLLRVFRAGLPIAEVDLPATGLSIGGQEGDDLRFSALGIHAREGDGGRVVARGGAWAFVPRAPGAAEVVLETGKTVAVGDALLEAVGSPAARVLDVSSLVQDEPTRAAKPEAESVAAKRLHALCEAVDSLDRDDDAGGLGAALSRALALAGARRGFAGVLAPDGRGLHVLASVGLDASDPRSQVSRSVVEGVLRDGREVATGDATHEVPTTSVRRLDLRTICAVPVRTGERVLGVVYADAGRNLDMTPGALLPYLRVLAALVGRRLAEDGRRREEADHARAAAARERDAPEEEVVVWASETMRRLRDEVERVASLGTRSLPVLLTGETGSGKEVLARWLHHRAEGGRGRFVPVNCAAIPRDLAESELFGIEQGVATGVLRRLGRFQQADGGTLFLDEIGEMDSVIQGKVLRTIETRRLQRVGGRDEIPVDVRIVSATNRPLADAIRAGRFREDLYWRLCGVELRVPPLRERREDVSALAQAFLRRFAREYHAPVETIAPAALARLSAHAWPGNVRELRQRVGAMVVLARGRRIEEDDVLRNLAGGASGPGDAVETAPHGDPALRSIADVEREHVRRVLTHVGGDAARAAEVLGIHRKTLRRWLKSSE